MNAGMFGSASFIEPEGQTFEEACNGEKLFLGGKIDDPASFLSLKPEKHFLTVAQNRSGKGASLIMPNLLNYKGSILVIDPKGENAFITAQRRRDMGQKVYILDPWGEVTRRYGQKIGIVEEVATFNPLSILDPNDESYSDDIAYFADALILSQSEKDPFFDDSARELVSGLIAFAVEKHGINAGLPHVREMLQKSAEEIAEYAIEAQGFGYGSLAARKLGRFTKTSETIGSVLQTAQTQTAILDSPALGKSLSESSFSFDDLTAQPTTIYLVLPVDKLQTYGRWLRLMISIGIRTIARNTDNLPLPVLFLLDEFGTIGKLSAVAQAFGLMAGLQMCVWAFVQDLVQLKRDYPHDWETFVSNSAALICFGVMDDFTTTYISKMLGQTTVEQVSEASAYVREATTNKGFATDKDRPHSRPLMTSDEVRRLQEDRGIVITNKGPYFFKKTQYHKEPRLSSLGRANPYYDSAPRSTPQNETAPPQWKKEESAPQPLPSVETRRGPAKTNIELQLAAFREQLLIPLGQKAKEPLLWWASSWCATGSIIIPILALTVSLRTGISLYIPVGMGVCWILYFCIAQDGWGKDYKSVKEARKYSKIFGELESIAVAQNEKMRSYGIEDLDGFGYHEQNRHENVVNTRSIKATLKRNAEKIAQHEGKN